MLAQNNFIGNLIKEFFASIISEHSDPNYEIKDVADVRFNHGGKILEGKYQESLNNPLESVIQFSAFNMNFTEEVGEYKHRLFTFEAKLKNHTQPKRFSFMVVSSEELEFIETLKNTIEKNKDKPDQIGNLIEGYPLGNQNILDFVKIMAPSSAHYSFLAIENQGKFEEHLESDSNSCIELLQAFNRLRN